MERQSIQKSEGVKLPSIWNANNEEELDASRHRINNAASFGAKPPEKRSSPKKRLQFGLF